jgi:membrane-associated phospholipid phosphatase
MWTNLRLDASGLALGPALLFRGWDHQVLALLFRLFPHTDPRMNIAEFFIYNPLASSWVLAAAFYFYWRMENESTQQRRSGLLQVVLACAIAVSVTLLLRPWLGAPSPARNPDFQGLFPPYLWGSGSTNTFPSHATLVYFLVAIGLWPYSRRWSAALGAWVILAISIPRMYMGGHYPTDVLGAMLLAFAFLWVARRLGATHFGAELLGRVAGGGLWIELLLFLWLFELAEGFRASLEITQIAAHAIARIF